MSPIFIRSGQSQNLKQLCVGEQDRRKLETGRRHQMVQSQPGRQWFLPCELPLTGTLIIFSLNLPKVALEVYGLFDFFTFMS